MTTLSPSFTAGGLASGLDSASIIDGLVKLQQRPIDLLRRTQSGLKSQVSTLGDLASKLSALEAAAKALGSGGVLGVKAASTNTSFAAVPGTPAAPGSHEIEVKSLATAAKARSAAFAQDATVRGGTLEIVVDGTHYMTTGPDGSQGWSDGASLEEVAAQIRASGAPVTAAVLFDGTSSYLSVTRRDTGFAGDDAAQALVLLETTTGAGGQPLGLAPLKNADGSDRLATNARFEIDGLSFTRTRNVVSDALPGTTLTLKAIAAPETLTLETDLEATRKKLQTYVDAHNAVIGIVQRQLSPAQNTDRAATLGGNSTVRALQQALQTLGSHQTPGLGAVASLADLGVKTNRDGTLAIVDATLAAAVASAPAAVDALFSTAETGLAAVVSAAVQPYVRASDGLLALARSGMDGAIARMDDEAEKLQVRLDAYRATLQAQFASMEQVVSQYKSIGTFLSQSAGLKQDK